MARLLSEPFHMPLSEIAQLTDRQIAELCFHPRDEEGRLVAPPLLLPGEDEELTLEQQHELLFSMGRTLGVPEAELQRAWREKHGEGEDR